MRFVLGLPLGLAVVAGWTAAATHAASPRRTVQVTLSGGFEIRSNDYGRPVPLYASMLGVSPDVFRQAFSGVHPDRGHAPTQAQQQANKDALLRVLGPYGVTNDAMDRVADYYRFDSSRGETWPRRAARAEATITGGKVTAIRVIDPGVGYTYPARVAVPGFPKVRATVELVFTRDFRTNGHVGRISLR
jgi:hypothetical protein